MNIKNTFRSWNFRNNKIINAKVDTPIEDSHIAPKIYVDENTTYNTNKSNDYQNPFKFNWITNVTGKSFKQIFDELFFPRIIPDYINPTFINVNIKADDEYYVTNKKAIFQGRINNFKLNYEITESDRISGLTPSIIIVDNNNNSTIINGTETSDISGTIEFSFNYKNIQSIILRKVFEETNITKYDSYNDIVSIPLAFSINYNLDFDLLSLINSTFEVYPPMIIYKIPNGDNFSEVFVEIQNNGDLSSTTIPPYQHLIKDRQIIIDGDNNLYLIGIPSPLYNKAEIIVHTNLSKQTIDSSMLDDGYIGSENDSNIVTLNYFGVPYKYFFGSLNFGYFSEPKTINFQFKLNK